MIGRLAGDEWSLHRNPVFYRVKLRCTGVVRKPRKTLDNRLARPQNARISWVWRVLDGAMVQPHSSLCRVLRGIVPPTIARPRVLRGEIPKTALTALNLLSLVLTSEWAKPPQNRSTGRLQGGRVRTFPDLGRFRGRRAARRPARIELERL